MENRLSEEIRTEGKKNGIKSTFVEEEVSRAIDFIKDTRFEKDIDI